MIEAEARRQNIARRKVQMACGRVRTQIPFKPYLRARVTGYIENLSACHPQPKWRTGTLLITHGFLKRCLFCGELPGFDCMGHCSLWYDEYDDPWTFETPTQTLGLEASMSVLEILAEAASHGVTMSLDGGKLALRATSEPPADLLARIKDHTTAIIRHLVDRQGSGGLAQMADFPPAELFADNVRKSLLCHSEILDHPFDPEDFRMARIKSDTATAVLNVASRGSPDQLRIKQDANRVASPRLMERVIEARRILAVRRSRHD